MANIYKTKVSGKDIGGKVFSVGKDYDRNTHMHARRIQSLLTELLKRQELQSG